jgi:hypothetical protein
MIHVCKIFPDSFEETEYPRQHIQRLRRHPLYKESYIVMIVESNMSWLTADRLALIAAKFPPYTIVTTDSDHHVGVYTDNISKIRYQVYTNKFLVEKKLGLVDEHQMIGLNVKKDLPILKKQLEQFEIKYKRPPDNSEGFVLGRITTSGKSQGKQDDAVMCLQINLYWQVVKHLDTRFKHTCQMRGYALSSS